MTVIYREHVAHVRHECAWECGDPIRIGERYVRASLTPNDAVIGNEHWWHHALHGRSLYDCPSYASDRNALAAKGDWVAVRGATS